MNENDDKVIIVYDESKNQLTMNLRYINENYDFDRFFNFERKATELCSRIIGRIRDNILKMLAKKLKKSKQNCGDIEIKVNLFSKNENDSLNLDQLTCLEAFVINSDSHFLEIEDKRYIFEVNPPLLTTLELPKRNIMAGFLVYPSKLEGTNFNVNDTLFKWFRSRDRFEDNKAIKNNKPHDITWEHFGDGFKIFTSNEDISRMLKVIGTPIKNNRIGPESEAVFCELISPNPGPCPFERRHLFTKNVLGKDIIRVVSYNILADLYADSDHSRNVLYPYCPNYALDIEYRKQLIIKEILGYNADILCLQEVDEKVFERDLKPVLVSFGFDGNFRTKGGTSVSEGLAVFYRKEKLSLREICYFVYSEELESNPLFKDLLNTLKRFPSAHEKFKVRTTILQVSIFTRVDYPLEILVVGSTHLYFEPYSDHIRLLQAGMGLDILRQIMNLQKAKNPDADVSIIICGDFNSAPENGVYRLMTTQFIGADDPDWSSKPGEEVNQVSFSHDLEISSACGVPDYTNYTFGFHGCLDYIFYQTDKFSLQQIIPFPTHEEVTEHGALPSVTFPSDHIALVADLKWNSK